MKYLFICLFQCIYLSLYAQLAPIAVDFVETNPLWVHSVEDTNFYQASSNPNITEYNTAYPQHILRKDNSLIIYSRSTATNGDSYGYILEKVDIETGEIDWTYFNTFYNNKLSQEYFNNIYFNDDGNIELLGAGRDTIPPSNPGLFTMWDIGDDGSFLMRKNHDFLNGNINLNVMGTDSINLPGRLLKQFSYKNEYLWILPTVIYDSTFQTNYNYPHGFKFYKINENQIITLENPYDTVMYETDDLLTPFSIESHFPILQLDEMTYVGIVFQDRYDPVKFRAQMFWVDVSDQEKVHVIRRKNIEKIIPWTFERLVFSRFRAINNQIYLLHYYYNEEIQSKMAYLLWLDAQGNVKNMLYKPMIDDHVYHGLSVIHSNDDYTLCMGFPSLTGRNGADFLRIKNGVDSLEYISSLTSANEDEYYYENLRVNKLFDDGKFIIGALTHKRNAEIDETWLMYYCFDAKELGIDLSVSAYEINLKELKIYPNPTSDYFYIDLFDSTNEQVVLNIINNEGQIISSQSLFTGSSHKIDIRNFSSGIYYIQLFDSQSKLIKSGKIVKLE